MILDSKLSFEGHLKSVLVKVNETSGIIRKFRLRLSRDCSLAINTLPAHHLDYDDVIDDRAYNESFHKKNKSIQYNATLVWLGVHHLRNSTKN